MNLPNLSIQRPTFITSIVILMLVVGWLSLKNMAVDLFPDVTFPIVFIQNIYPGASPVDMEKLVSRPIEDEMGSLPGLDTMQALNSESVSYLILKFDIGTDIKDTEQQIRQRLGNIRNSLPEEMNEPIIRRFDPADMPVVQFALVSDMDPAKLYDVANEIVKPQFETLPGVGQVDLLGGAKKEIHVDVNQDKLQDRQLTLLQIINKIKNTSKDVPIGKIDDKKNETVFRSTGEFTNLDELKKVSINFFGSDQSVLLEEVAKVKESLEEVTSFTVVQSKADQWQKKPSIFLSVYKQSGENTVGVVDEAKNAVSKVNDFLKQRGIAAEIKFVRDSAGPIRANIADVTESIVIGIVLTIFVVFFFLGSGRSTFITALALPNSLLGGFILMYAMGFSINILTLLALSLAVGLLIDDAIVVRENIFRHMEMGKTPLQAALQGTKEVSLAVIATTLVVISVFGPVAFLSGIVGQFFKQFGLTVVFTMLISLFDAFTVAPMLSAHWAGDIHGHSKHGMMANILAQFEKIQLWLENRYEETLKWVLMHRRIVVVLAFGSFFASLLTIGWIPKTFIPSPDNGEFLVNIETPVGTSLDSTKIVTQQVEDLLKSEAYTDLLSTTAGVTSGTSRGGNLASIYVKLVPKKQRPGQKKTTEVKDEVREKIKQLNLNANILIADINIAGDSEKMVNLHIKGDDLEVLSAYAEKLKKRFQTIPGFVDIDTNYRSGKPEFHVEFDRLKAENLGVSAVTAGSELRARMEGVVASTYREKGIEYDIRVRLDESQRDLRAGFSNTMIPNANYNLIPLSRVATGQETTGFSQINRLNKSRFINLSGNVGKGGALASVIGEMENIIKTEPEFAPPSGILYNFFGQAEDMKDLFSSMLTAMGLGVLLIYLVLASLYESYITPLTILLALPMAVSGALIALLLFGKTLDIFSMIGFIMLLGVVAKNSILLVDYAQQLIYQGVERQQALIQAGKVRLRPILMTSLALVAGILPIAIGLNEASSQRTSMGVAIIGGLLSSTALTLVVVPAAFGYIDDFRLWSRKILGLSNS